jgi:hypothetical protein
MVMADWLQATAVSFLGAVDRLMIADLPFATIANDPDTLAVSELASDLACQRSCPLYDHTLPQLLLWDVADAWLAWIADPLNPDRQEELQAARRDCDAACGIGLDDDDD